MRITYNTNASVGAQAANMDIQKLAAYEVISHEFLPDVDSDSWLLRHKKTGARIALLPKNDNNKVFYIAFRTPPEDSTGVAHIIEHTVLCGSRDFPVKDPFIELAKGSLNTFLNAMTYPDKTVYPVASCNEQDFKNLMHVYLDAVFYPNIYREQNIFRQEGWHYEAESADSEITVNGVVYNEMKGALSSADDILGREINAVLYPHTPYRHESGGDPVNIPDLTYENYLEFHRRYYHPSNSYIYLYGDMDMTERLTWIDEHYLSRFNMLDIDSSIPAEPAFDAPVEAKRVYSILPEEDPSGKSFLSWNLAVLPDSLDVGRIMAVKILNYALCDAEGAPVRKALRDKGIGEDVYTIFESGVRQPFYSIVSKYADPARKDEFVSTIRETLRQAGFKPEQIRLVMNDTKYTPNSGPAGGSRSQVMSGNACRLAAEALLAEMKKDDGTWRTYDEMVADGKKLKVEGNWVTTYCADHPVDQDTAQGEPFATYMYTIFLPEVCVDTQTGKVKVEKFTAVADVGTIMNKLLVDGNFYGGLTQGIGLALSEDFDDLQKETSLLRCGIPYPNDVPDDIELHYNETYRPNGPYGAAGCGEAPLDAPHPAILNAIYNATGARITRIPARPDKVLAALKALEK